MKYCPYNHNWPAYEPIFQQGPSWHRPKNHYCRFLIPKKIEHNARQDKISDKNYNSSVIPLFFSVLLLWLSFSNLNFYKTSKSLSQSVKKKEIILSEKVWNAKIVSWSCHKNIFFEHLFMDFVLSNSIASRDVRVYKKIGQNNGQ